MTVRIIDKGYKEYIKKMKALGRKPVGVEVGVIGESGSYQDGVSVIQVALWAEYGIGQPQRSWLRGWVKKHDKDIKSAMKQTAFELGFGVSPRVALGQLGVAMAASMKMNIRSGIPPANSPVTIARKGSSTPLINTGQFIGSIAHKNVGV